MTSLPLCQPPGPSCGECRACCVAFPFLPEEGFWPEGKRAHEPCRFICASGCRIHEEPRPSGCTDFVCAYLAGNFAVRPDQCGVIFHDRSVAFCREIENRLGLQVESDGRPAMLYEMRAGAILEMDRESVRAGFEKMKSPYLLAVPFGLDTMYGGQIRGARSDLQRTIVCLVSDRPAYADRVIDWWLGRTP